MNIESTYFKLKAELDARDVELVAVSKTYSAAHVMQLYDLGHRVFGENRVQEMLSKKVDLPEDIQWHLIGHLQSNKVRQVVGEVHMIESVDSIKLLRRIHKEADAIGVRVNVLLQIKIAAEDTKYGFDPETIMDELVEANATNLSGLHIRGVMGMASFVDDPDQVHGEFMSLKRIFENLRKHIFASASGFDQISMGMSGDYPIAIECGSTIVRIGSLLFGART